MSLSANILDPAPEDLAEVKRLGVALERAPAAMTALQAPEQYQHVEVTVAI